MTSPKRTDLACRAAPEMHLNLTDSVPGVASVRRHGCESVIKYTCERQRFCYESIKETIRR